MPRTVTALANGVDEQTSPAVLGTATSASRGFMELADRDRLIALAEASDVAALRDLARIYRNSEAVRARAEDEFETINDPPQDP